MTPKNWVHVSIQLVSPASGETRPSLPPRQPRALSFHSISFPSEWGVEECTTPAPGWGQVSIQLVSPASGELTFFLSSDFAPSPLRSVSIQLVSPASGEIVAGEDEFYNQYKVSIQLVSPASGEVIKTFRQRYEFW